MNKTGVVFACMLLLAGGSEGVTNDPAPDEAAPVGQVTSRSTGMMAKAAALMAERKWDSAADLYRQILKVYPDDVKSACGLGTSLLQLKHYREALDVFVPLQAKLPDDPTLKNNIAWIYATCGDPALRNVDEAVKLARQATLAMPNDPNIWNTLAEAHYAAAEYDMAFRTARISLQLAQDLSPLRASEFWETVRRCSKAAEAGKALVPQEP